MANRRAPTELERHGSFKGFKIPDKAKAHIARAGSSQGLRGTSAVGKAAGKKAFGDRTNSPPEAK